MARIEPLGHWDYLIEGMQASSDEYYQSVEKALEEREVPGASMQRVHWKESGILSGEREYLRVTRGQYVIDICGAPFGKGYFFSWWLGTPRPSSLGSTLVAYTVIFGLLFVSFFMAVAIIAAFPNTNVGFISFSCLALWPASVTILFVLIGAHLQRREPPSTPYFLSVFIIGDLWQILFLPETYYRTDTRIMYQTAVHAAVMEVIDSMTKAQNLERITDDARKPIMRDLFKR